MTGNIVRDLVILVDLGAKLISEYLLQSIG